VLGVALDMFAFEPSARDAQRLALVMRSMRDAAHGKPYALTEIGTQRLPLIARAANRLPASTEQEVAAASAVFFVVCCCRPRSVPV